MAGLMLLCGMHGLKNLRCISTLEMVQTSVESAPYHKVLSKQAAATALLGKLEKLGTRANKKTAAMPTVVETPKFHLIQGSSPGGGGSG
jgi:hypothetical protein